MLTFKLSIIPIFFQTLVFATSNDSLEVKQCFNNYKQAILVSDGEEAIKWVDEHTLQYYEEILSFSLSADSSAIQERTLMDKLTILSIRHRVPKEEVLKMSGDDFFKYAINEGMVGKNSVMNIEIGEVSIEGEFATGNIVASGQKSPLNFHFYKEEDAWKIDLTSIFQVSNAGLSSMIKSNGMTENEFIFSSLEMLTGKKVEDSIWEPLK